MTVQVAALKTMRTLKLFNPQPQWGDGALAPVLEKVYAPFRRPDVEKPGRKWLVIRPAMSRGYSQISSRYSEKNKVRYVLDRKQPVVLRGLANGKGHMMLDGSGEGIRFWSPPMEDLHEDLKSLSISPDRITFVSSSVEWKRQYTEWLASTDYEPINVCYHNYYFYRLAHEINDLFSGQSDRDHFIAESLADVTKVRGKKFTFMNFSPRAHRVIVMLDLDREGELKNGYVSLPSLDNKSIVFPEPSSGARAFPTLLQEYEAGIEPLRQKLPLLLDSKIDEKSSALTNRLLPANIFGDSYFSITAETDYAAEPAYARRFTEKTLQCFLRMHPFVLIGDAGTLGLLKNLGFATFEPFIDETYDTITDPEERMRALLEEIRRLNRLSDDDWRDMRREMIPILHHNAELLFKLPDIMAAKWDLPLFQHFAMQSR